MKTNVCLTSSIRQPFRSLLLLTLIGIITFGFITKAVEFILVQRETEVLGSYYRSIGLLENITDPESGDISAGIEMIEASPYLGYSDQREVVSGVMPQTYNQNFRFCNCNVIEGVFPEEEWPNVHITDIWFTGELIDKQEMMTQNGTMVGYYLGFDIDTVLAGYPEYATEDMSLGLFILSEGNESAIPIIGEMVVGQRYLMRGWEDIGTYLDYSLDLPEEILYYTYLTIRPLDNGQVWYLPLQGEESIDFSDPAMAGYKNEIDILNENLHTLGIIATADMSAIPRMQEASRFYTLTEGRWLNYQDHLDGNKMIVIPEDFAILRGLQLGDELQLTFRPLTDTYLGLIRDGVDSDNWKSYPTYQDTYTIVGIFDRTNANSVWSAYVPANSIRPGFISATQDQFRWEADYSFVLDSSRHESEFVQAYKEPLQKMGISLTILENNGPAYWAAVEPILHALSADILVYGLLLVTALILAVFLYQMQRKRDYAILRALGVPIRKANAQFVRPLLLLGGLGIIAGGLTAWKYALDQARVTLSAIPTPAGVSPSAELSLIFLAGLCAAVFLLLELISLLAAFSLAHKPVFELLQGRASRRAGRKKEPSAVSSESIYAESSSVAGTLDHAQRTQQGRPAAKASRARERKYKPASLGLYVRRHILRSRLKSFLTLAIALGFVLAAAWIRQTMERSRLEVDQLYDTTVLEADILPTNTSTKVSPGKGFVYQKAINSVLDSEFVKSSVLAADTTWYRIERLEPQEKLTDSYPVYAYDSPEAFYSGLEDPGSIVFDPGWDMERFATTWTLEEIETESVPALFPVSMLEELQVNVGDKVSITDQFDTYTGVVVGQYEGWLATTVNSIKTSWISSTHHILIPLSVMEAMQEGQTKYAVAHFILDPEKNQELSQFRADMEEVMDVYDGALRFVIWDEELRIVIDQLEKNISLLETLYPVVIVVSALVGAGLCFLLLLQSAREAAILRVLGTTRKAVRLALIGETFSLSLIGAVIGLGISAFLWMATGLVPFGSLLTIAGIYLVGALIGSVIGAIMVTNKMPLELLQVKE